MFSVAAAILLAIAIVWALLRFGLMSLLIAVGYFCVALMVGLTLWLLAEIGTRLVAWVVCVGCPRFSFLINLEKPSDGLPATDDRGPPAG